MPGESLQTFPTAAIPDLDADIPTARGNALAIGTVGHFPNIISVTIQGFQAFSTADIPNLDGMIVAPRDECGTVWTIGHLILTVSFVRCPAEFCLGKGQPTKQTVKNTLWSLDVGLLEKRFLECPEQKQRT